MPELPEVETIKLGLARKIRGRKIKKVWIFNPKSFIGNPNLIKGKTVLGLKRWGKVLGVELEGGLVILIHLKMSGQLIWVSEAAFKFTRVVFEFDDRSKLYFNDQRKFGWVKVVETDKLKMEALLSNMGPEPLAAGFTLYALASHLVKRQNTPVKSALLDQSVVAGIGNIYACEALFKAMIDPRKKVGQLSDKNFEDLYQAVIQTLKKGISLGGSSKLHFVDISGKKGKFLDSAFVYNREGKSCKVCGFAINKIKLAGRGTYYCPSCQK